MLEEGVCPKKRVQSSALNLRTGGEIRMANKKFKSLEMGPTGS